VSAGVHAKMMNPDCMKAVFWSLEHPEDSLGCNNIQHGINNILAYIVSLVGSDTDYVCQASGRPTEFKNAILLAFWVCICLCHSY
jgi:hypothetical protein